MRKKTIIKAILILSFTILSGFSNYVSAQTVKEYQQKGDDFVKANNYKQAYDCYNTAIANNKDNEVRADVLYCKRGICETGLKLINQAISDFSTAISINSQLGMAYWGRGDAYDKNENYQLSINDYTKALSYFQNNSKALSSLFTGISIGERKLRHYSKAISADSVAIVLNPDNNKVYLERAISYVAVKEYQLAIADYTTAMGYSQGNKEALSSIYLSRAFIKGSILKQYTNALNDYALAIQLNPNNKMVYYNRCYTYYANGDYKLAMDDYNAIINSYIISDDPKNKNTLAIFYDGRALTEIKLRRYNEAIQDDSVAIRLNPQYGAAYWDMANTYTSNGEEQAAIENYKKSLNFYTSNNNSSCTLHWLIADNEYSLKNYNRAIDECAAAIALNAKSNVPYYYMAKAYLKLGNKDLAKINFKKAIEADSTKKSVYCIFSLYYTGNAKGAIKAQQDCILNTNNSFELLNAYYNMACLLSLDNKRDEANVYLKKAIDGGHSKAYALKDEDFNNLRNTVDFKNIFADSNLK
jgi:tetratricopeptide (TPR) repeat protein